MDESVKIPSGYHFAPFEQELISLYLKPKVLGQKLPCNIVEVRQIYGPNADPWQLFDPESHPWILSQVTPGKFDKITYVFVNLTKKGTAEGKKYGKRENYIKKAGCGTWDGQTKRTEIRDWNGDLIGERRMLAFEINEVSDQDLSKLGHWRMHEYHLCGVNKDISNPSNTVLCKIILDSSKNPHVKLKLCSKGNPDQPIKSNNEPEKKNTNVHIASSPSTVNSGSVGSNQGDFDISEEDTAVIVTSPPKQVKTGYLNPSISDFHWPAKNDTTTNLGKRKLRAETSYTMAKKLRGLRP
ncbi:hypothetical protein POM88_036441 [Heracleum sosnowskyi]|uniref:NAC domain-containing protein n=1 Tax=Heracleum sosnowskyi TaxID=360622 RepID=A0AAD8HPT0_9APIA|nr:hypothetical protein POM88_036440 [Heracleum sosnowskyi]KAK1370349.1 hypothetical protein POM88_036441 [Heracleum sosnowskyi]